MGHHDQGVLLGGGALTRAQQDGIEVQALCRGRVGGSELGGGGGAQPYWGYSLYWGCSCSGGGCRVRMLQLMPGTGAASCRQTHCTCASRPALGRTATFCVGRRVSANPERGCWALGRGHHLTSVWGQLGVENLATKMSRSMVRTDQLPWGASGEEGGQTCRCDPLPSPGTRMVLPAWHSPAVSKVVAPVTVSTTNMS